MTTEINQNGRKPSVRKILADEYEDFLQLSLIDRWRILDLAVSFGLVLLFSEIYFPWGLILLLINLLRSWNSFRNSAVYEIIEENSNNNNKTRRVMGMTENNSLQGIFQGADLNGVQINVLTGNHNKIVYKEVTGYPQSENNESTQVTDEQVANAIMQSQSLFWAQSAWAVVFCVCRDYLGMADNMTEFERYVKTLPFTQQLSYDCPEGTIQSTLKNNPYMRFPISKWQENGGKERAVLLAKNLKSALEQK